MAAPGVVWEFDDGHLGWRPYTAEVVARMEAALSAGESEATYSFGQWHYTVFFQTMLQMNMMTGTSRPVRRTPPVEEAVAAVEPVTEAGVHREHPAWLPHALGEQLSDLLLSPASCTEAAAEQQPLQHQLEPPERAPEELAALMRRHVPGIDGMMDRTGRTPVLTFVLGTCQSGLPLYREVPSVQAHTIRAIRAIFDCAARGVAGAAEALRMVAEAFQSCQAEQGRTIDAVYGRLSGRDASFRAQLLSLVDSHKDMLMQKVVLKLNPAVGDATDATPAKQAPHITSAYLRHCGLELGMRGVEAARADGNAPELGPESAAQVMAALRQEFSAGEVVEAVVADVNQQEAGAQRVLDRDALAAWAASPEAAAAGFDKHSIYYEGGEEEEEEEEEVTEAGRGVVQGSAAAGRLRPTPENKYQPFLSLPVAAQMLLLVVRGGEAAGVQ